MNYWLVKGKPARNKLDAMLEKTEPDRWDTEKSIPKDMAAGDRVFLYESSPKKRLIALATVSNPRSGQEGSYNFFTLRYLTQRFADMPHQDEIRRIPGLENPSFLKSGNAATIYRVEDTEAKRLYNLIIARNPLLSSFWSDLSESSEEAEIDLPWNELSPMLEGNRILRLHFVRERDPGLIRDKKQQVLDARGSLACEVCDFDFRNVFEDRGSKFCEVHHRFPLSKNEPRQTPLEDLAIVCSNCHRMLHKEPWITVEELRLAIRHARPTLEHRGYEGSVIYSAEDHLLHGRLLGIRDVVIYGGESIDIIETNFRDAVDEYLSFCSERGKSLLIPANVSP